MQLKEMGFDSIYSRRVFHYLHPEDLEEVLNFMPIENGIIQHRFVKNRRETSRNLCYICGEEKDRHLKDLNININIEDNKEVEIDNNKRNNNIINILKNSIRLDNTKINKREDETKEKSNTKECLIIDIKNSEKEETECDICNDIFIVNDNNKVEKCGHTFL